ncbi:MAG TPA: hypothetical protein VF045_00265, partial [Acidimicrobiales bacterium]
ARERMMAAALDAAGGEHVAKPAAAAAPAAAGPAPAPAPVVPLPVPREPRKWWLGGAAAAAVVAVGVGAAGMLGRGTDEGTDTALSGGGGAGAAAEFESPTMAAGPPPAGAPRVTEAGDLGDVPNVESLRSRVAVANATSRANRGAAAPAGTAQDSLATAAPTTVPAPVPREIGTRPCEEQARTARPQVGGLVYVATARFAGTPAIVLGFAASAEGPPATVLVLAESGCRLLAETSVP